MYLKRSLFIFLLFIISLAGLIFWAELLVRVFHPSRLTEIQYEGNGFQRDPLLGKRGRPNGVMKEISKVEGRPVQEVSYNFDDQGWRKLVSKQKIQIKKDRFFIIFGGSQLFGIGVNDGETVPSYLAEKFPSHQIHNLTFQNYNPSMYYLMARDLPSYAQIKQKTGIALFYFDHKMPVRVIGSSRSLRGWGLDAPLLVRDKNGEIRHRGSFQMADPWRTKILLWFSKLRLLDYFGIDIPISLSLEQYKFVCSLLHESRKEILKRHPATEFFVFHFENEGFGKMEPCFFREGFRKISLKIPPTYVDNVGHFDAEGARVVALELEYLLKKDSTFLQESAAPKRQ